MESSFTVFHTDLIQTQTEVDLGILLHCVPYFIDFKFLFWYHICESPFKFPISLFVLLECPAVCRGSTLLCSTEQSGRHHPARWLLWIKWTIPLMFKCVPAASFLVLSVVLPFLVQLHDSLQVPLIFFSFSSQSPSSVLTCLTELASCTYTISVLVLEDFADSHGNHLW